MTPIVEREVPRGRVDCHPDSPADWQKCPFGELVEVNPRYPMERGREYPFLDKLLHETSMTDDTDASFRADPHIGKMLAETFEWAGLNLNAVFDAVDKMFASVTDRKALVLIGREARDEWTRHGAAKRLTDQAGLASIARAELSRGEPSSEVLLCVIGKLADTEFLQVLASDAPDKGVKERARQRLQEVRKSGPTTAGCVPYFG